MKSILKYSFLVATAFMGQSCNKDFLNAPPLNAPTSGAFYKTDAEIMAGTAPLYNIVWFDYNDKAFMSFGEGRGGNLNSNDRTAFIQFSVSPTDVATLLPAYKSFYKIIGQSNVIMQNIKMAEGSTASDAIKSAGLGECRFMRGLAYYYLVTNWGPVPIVYDNSAQLSNDLPRNTIESIWELIIRDFTYAADHLPETALAQGRVTKWSAKAMLAKMYLMKSGLGKGPGSRSQSDLDNAKKLAKEVITGSPYSLMPNYYDLFRSEFNNSSNNNSESLFALQWMPIREPWGINNSFQAYMAFDPKITQTGDGWGSAQGGSADLVKYYVNHPEDSVRRKATLMFQGDYYPELNKKGGGTTVTTGNIANIKKYVVGSPDDNGGKGVQMGAYVNTYMLRLAELYLIYAEAILGNNTSTSDPEALKYYNAVRTRAGLNPATSITFDDIFEEKRVETAIEGTLWYEILRMYYFNPAKAVAYVGRQDRGNYTLSYIAGSNPRRWNFSSTPFYATLNAENIYLPYPESEKSVAKGLSEPPVPFDFSKLPD